VLVRILVALLVGTWSFLFVSAALALATTPVVQILALLVGGAPVALLVPFNRYLARREVPHRAVLTPGEKQRQLLRALHDRGELTPATAALHTSLTIDEASDMLEELARKGHVQMLLRDGMLAYALFDASRQAPGGSQATPGVPTGDSAAQPAACASPEPLVEPLSERELEVLRLLATGRSNKEIASVLVVSVGTIKTHTNNIYRKLGARNRTEALTRAQHLNLL
jgi:ATP/maltotriose-dependent transcriptional regulator MalT